MPTELLQSILPVLPLRTVVEAMEKKKLQKLFLRINTVLNAFGGGGRKGGNGSFNVIRALCLDLDRI